METLAADLRTMVRTPLADAHVAAMRKRGGTRTLAEGETLYRYGDVQENFCYVLSGELEGIDPVTGERYGAGTLGPTQFFGEISFLWGGPLILGARAVRETEILCGPRDAMLDLMSQTPEMSDIIITVFAARRRRLLEVGRATLTLIGAETDRTIRQIASFAGRNRIPYRSLTLDEAEAEALAEACDIARGKPAVLYGKSEVLPDPTPRKVAERMGLDLQLGDRDWQDVLIVGGGPAGVAAAVYAGSEGLRALVLEDLAIGGQAGTSSRIENYMGFPTGISGADLCWRGEVQAMKFGTRFAVPRRAIGLECVEGGFRVALDDGAAISARSLVVATGVQYRRLGIDRLEHFESAGVYYAATDVEARYCRNTEVAVVGGGNSAGQAAMFLARTAAHVHLLVRGGSLASSMSRYLSSRLEAHPRITIHYRTEMTCLHGEDQLDCIDIHDKQGGETWRLNTKAVFIMVGAAPNTDWLSGHVALDDKGFVLTGQSDGMGAAGYATSLPGIFAVGDVRAGSVKRVASAVGEGSVVISQVWSYLDTAPLPPEMADAHS